MGGDCPPSLSFAESRDESGTLTTNSGGCHSRSQLIPMSPSHPRPLLALAYCLVMLGIPKTSEAIEWVADPSVRLGLEYNDNISLTTAPHKSVSGTNLTTNLDLGARQENWDLWGGVRLSRRRYVDRDDLDGDDRSANLRYQFRTERNLWALKGSYADESILNPATIDPDVGNQTTRTTTSINPAWSRSLTETTQLRVDYQYFDTQYENDLSLSLLDYRQQAVNLTVSDQLTQRTNVYAILGYSNFEVTSPESQIKTSYTSASQTNTAQLGISHDFTETLKGNLSGGPRKTTSETRICGFLCLARVTEADTSYGSVFKGSLESRLELTRTTIGLSRSIDPSGSGSEVQTNNLSLTIDRQITPERLSARFVADGYKFEALGATSSSIDRNYYRLEPGLRWRWTRDITLDASYRYSRQRYLSASATEVASANAVFVTFSYTIPKRSISR